MVPARETFPDPGPCKHRIVLKECVPDVIGIQDADSGSIRGRRVAAIGIAHAIVFRGREGGPFARVGQEQAVAALLAPGHPHEVLLRFTGLIGLNHVDEMNLPGRIAHRIAVRDLIDHIVEIVDGVDHFPHIGFLGLGDRRHLKRMRFGPVAVAIRVSVDSAHIVGAVVGMIAPDVARGDGIGGIHDRPKVEQHDADIDPTITGGDHP